MKSLRRSNTPNHSGRGITLLEVMVVLVLVLLLTGAVWTVAHKGLAHAQMAQSTSNLRQLALANEGYVIDHGTYAPATDRANLKRWHGARSSSKKDFDPAEGYLAPYLGESREVGFCPRLEQMISDPGSWESGAGGYGYNAAYIGGTPRSPFKPNRPANVRSSRTIMFATTAFAKSDGLQEYPFAEPYQWVDPNGNPGGDLQPSVHFRFNNRALLCWCDGTVTTADMETSSDTNYYGGSNEEHNIGFPGPEKNNGWFNPGR